MESGVLSVEGVHRDVDLRHSPARSSEVQLEEMGGPSLSRRGDGTVGDSRPSEAKPPSFDSLPLALMLEVLKTIDERSDLLGPLLLKEHQQEPLLPLRLVSRSFREAVDETLSLLFVKLWAPDDDSGAATSARFAAQLASGLPRWRRLRHLALNCDLPPRALALALHTLASARPSALRRLSIYTRSRPLPHAARLQHAHLIYSSFSRRQMTDQDLDPLLDQVLLTWPPPPQVRPGPVSLRPLANLPVPLQALHLTGFELYTDWWTGLSALQSLQELKVWSTGPGFILEPLPCLTHLLVTGSAPGFFTRPDPPTEFPDLDLSVNLQEIHLQRVRVPELRLPPTVCSVILNGVHIERDSHCALHLPALTRLDVRGGVLETGLPPMAALTALTSLHLVRIGGSVSEAEALGGISSLHQLTSLTVVLDRWRNARAFGVVDLSRLSILHNLHLQLGEYVTNFKAPDNLSGLWLEGTHRGLQGLPSFHLPATLRILYLKSFPTIQELFDLRMLPVLEVLEVRQLSSLVALRASEGLLSLRALTVSYCGQLKEVSLDPLPALREVSFTQCPELKVDVRIEQARPRLHKCDATG